MTTADIGAAAAHFDDAKAASDALTAAGIPDDGRSLTERIAALTDERDALRESLARREDPTGVWARPNVLAEKAEVLGQDIEQDRPPLLVQVPTLLSRTIPYAPRSAVGVIFDPPDPPRPAR